MSASMPFDQDEFLTRALLKAGSKAEIGRILDKPSSRIAEIYKPGTKTRLTMKDGMALAEALDIPPAEPVNVESLCQVLRVSLRHAPREWTDQAVERLAQEILHGLELQREILRGLHSDGGPSSHLPDGPQKPHQGPNKRA